MDRTRHLASPVPLSDIAPSSIPEASAPPVEAHVPIYIAVPSGGPESLQQSVDKARNLGLKVDRVDSEVGAIVGSGPLALIEHLKNNGLLASQPARISYGV